MMIKITVGDMTDMFDIPDDVISTSGENFNKPRVGSTQSADDHVISSYRRMVRMVFWKNWYEENERGKS